MQLPTTALGACHVGKRENCGAERADAEEGDDPVAYF
jgi:hypothetical protein